VTYPDVIYKVVILSGEPQAQAKDLLFAWVYPHTHR